MTTGLITFHAAHHYGAQLQAFALMHAIKNCGSECVIVDYVRKDTIEGKSLLKKNVSIRSLISNLHTMLNYQALSKRRKRFDDFVEGRMSLTKSKYSSMIELINDTPECDTWVCGSDQIWNPLIYKEQDFDPVFFASFTEKGRKISYAPSFGISKMPARYAASLRKYLKTFSALSVREKTGEDIINSVSGQTAVTVLDPTLLLDSKAWKEISFAPEFAKPYILCYFISEPTGLSEYIKNSANKFGLKIVSLCGARKTVQGTDKIILDAGPEEFLGWFANAAMVFTDSFHGTIFSINFQKEFYSFTFASGGKEKVASRLGNILNIFGLTERLISIGTNAEFWEGVDGLKPINWNEVSERLEIQRALSLDFLRSALIPEDGLS